MKKNKKEIDYKKILNKFEEEDKRIFKGFTVDKPKKKKEKKMKKVKMNKKVRVIAEGTQLRFESEMNKIILEEQKEGYALDAVHTDMINAERNMFYSATLVFKYVGKEIKRSYGNGLKRL